MTLSDYFDNLHNAQNEDEVCECLKKIIKNFNSSFYRDELKDNPFFYSIIKDLKSEIIIEMQLMIERIKCEIDGMDDKLLNTSDHSEFLRLKDVRRECIYLLTALDNRLHGVYLL